MKKFWLRIHDFSSAGYPWIAVLSAFFLCGAVIGCITASYIDDVSGAALSGYVGSYLSMTKSAAQTGSLVGYAFFNAFKYHAAVFICGFSALGVLLIPLLLAARGFFLSFAVTVFVRLFGYNGLLFSAGVFGAQCLVSLPFLLLISAQAFLSAISLMSISFGNGRVKTYPVFSAGYFFRFGACALVLTLCALFEAFVSPLIAKGLSGLIW